MSRILDFSSVHNFRDFGNYGTQDGRRIAPRRLFRSAHLSEVSPQDMKLLENLEIGLVVDLRYKPERERQPNRLPTSRAPNVYEYPDHMTAGKSEYAPHEMFVKNDLRAPEDARNYMMTSYSTRPNDPGFQRIFSDTLRHMCETGDPILIHCAAGKDRTGTLAAIIHGALGVDQKTVMEDFMLTMTAVDIDSFLEPAAKMMSKRFGRDYDPESLRPMFGVEENYLRAALDTIGDMDAYISDTLGFSRDDIQTLRAHYLEET